MSYTNNPESLGMANISMISPMVDNVAVVMEQKKPQENTRRNKVEQETGRVIDRNFSFYYHSNCLQLNCFKSNSPFKILIVNLS